MIRKLRWKFVLTNMLMVTLILCGIAALVVSATRSSLRRNSLSVLYQASREGYSLTWPDVYRDSSAINLPYFSVMVGTDGSVVLQDNHFGAVEDTEQLRAIVQSCVDQEAQLGVLPDYRLRYLKQDRLLGCRIVFVDASQEWSTMASLLRLLGLIFAGTLVAFFLLSLFLARWATKPVEESWLAQRQFVSDASHELKTPLAVITANVDLLDRYGVDYVYVSSWERSGFAVDEDWFAQTCDLVFSEGNVDIYRRRGVHWKSTES
jgi:signal transduction histidine kinase